MINQSDLRTSALKNLIQSSRALRQRQYTRRFAFDMMSWVIGVSEVQISDFRSQLIHTRKEIEDYLKQESNLKLKSAITSEFEYLPEIGEFEFSPDMSRPFWYLGSVNPLKTIKMTLRFNSIMDQIERTSQNIINYYENALWLELKK